ncbi:hypothetical protein, partial [Bacillus cereus]
MIRSYWIEKRVANLLLFFSGCGESLLHSLFLCLNLFLCVNTDKKEEKERFFMMGALKNHR